MKPWAKLLLLSFGILAGILLVIWAGGILYWHVRITRALRSWENSFQSAPAAMYPMVRGLSREDSEVLFYAGCRALPHLVKAMEKSTDPEFQEGVMSRIISCLNGPGPATESTFELMNERQVEWLFLGSGLTFERTEKMAKFREWWQKNGHRYHQTWRFWTAWCYEE